MQISRLFEIVYLLMEQKTMTAQALAERLEVSARTILRDIDALSSAGVPVYTSQGRGGGISLMNNYVLDKTMLSQDEQAKLLFALRGLSSTGCIETESIVRKLGSLFENREQEWISVDFSRWGSRTGDQATFDLLKNAVISRRVLRLVYSSARGETALKTVYPLKLTFKSAAWYLQAYCLEKEGYRTYKITRMREIEPLDEYFGDGEFTAPPLEAPSKESPSLIELTLRFSPHTAYRVYDEFDGLAVAINVDGSFLVRACLPDEYWLYDYLMSFGTHVEVLEPESVRKKMARLGEEIARKHRDKT